MKILHIVAGDLSAGAARGAYWLHKAQRRLGIDSHVLTDSANIFDDDCITSTFNDGFSGFKTKIQKKIANSAKVVYPNRKNIIFNTGFSGIDVTDTLQYKNCDIIHLHWINGLIPIKCIGRIKKPIVWTLRDMWPLTGGCHYSMHCDNYKTGCGSCPQLGSSTNYDLSRYVTLQKQKHFGSNITLVGISNWISDCARSSSLFKSHTTVTISNNLDTAEFIAHPKNDAKKSLGLDTQKKYVLIGAQNLNDFYKGFDLLKSCLHQLKNTDMHLLVFGNIDQASLDEIGIPFTCYGFVNENSRLSIIYSAADVFVAPSRMEAFGKTLIESMACGTPVVCFDDTGPRDIVEHKLCGYKAIAFEPNDLATGVKWILNLDSRYFSVICSNAEMRARAFFDSDVIALQYKKLYEKLLFDRVSMF